MIGGMSWESSAIYYRLINQDIQRRLGGMHSAKTLLYSFDFQEIADLQDTNRWDEATRRMNGVGAALAKGGADFLIICCNTMHRRADAVEKAAGIPLLHIADPLGAAIVAQGIKRVGLLGSRHTMDQDSIVKGRLRSKFGLDVLVPEGAGDNSGLHRIAAAGETGRQPRAAVRYDDSACERGSGFGAGLAKAQRVLHLPAMFLHLARAQAGQAVTIQMLLPHQKFLDRQRVALAGIVERQQSAAHRGHHLRLAPRRPAVGDRRRQIVARQPVSFRPNNRW